MDTQNRFSSRGKIFTMDVLRASFVKHLKIKTSFKFGKNFPTKFLIESNESNMNRQKNTKP